MKLTEILHNQPKWLTLLEATLGTCVIGYFDYLLPFELTLFMFYVCPILFVAWFHGRPAALQMAAFCTFVWWLANLHTQPFTMEAYLWAAFNRLVSFSVVAVGGAAMRSERETMRARVADLERTHELEEEILRVAEREQMRIGQDLHDGLCQHLAAIDCAVACLQHDLEEQNLPEAESARFIQEQLENAITEARDMARGIFPVQIEEEGFLAALEELAHTTNRLRQLHVTLSVHGEIKIKDPQTGMHLFRIAQEALNNASKHAQADLVEIDLSRTDSEFAMRIADNGAGVRAERLPGKGIGMQTMRYRAKSLGGHLQIDPAPNGGTVVCCTVPMNGGPAPILAYECKN